jgi:hypothetical protein
MRRELQGPHQAVMEVMEVIEAMANGERMGT